MKLKIKRFPSSKGLKISLSSGLVQCPKCDLYLQLAANQLDDEVPIQCLNCDYMFAIVEKDEIKEL